MNLSRAGAKTCSPRCRKRLSRGLVFPDAMRARVSWVRADGKRPVTITGDPASSTDASTWTTFNDVKISAVGDGFGFMLGGGIGCYDFDNVTDAEARDLAQLIPERIIYAERSQSGRGVHVFVEADEGPGSKKWQGRHERYTRSRFILTTGNVFAGSFRG